MVECGIIHTVNNGAIRISHLPAMKCVIIFKLHHKVNPEFERPLQFQHYD